MKPSSTTSFARAALFLAVAASPAVAWADPAAPPATPAPKASAAPKPASGDYAYFFDTDSLGGSGLGPSSASIAVRPVLRSSLLIRPRLEFVSELQKSIENL